MKIDEADLSTEMLERVQKAGIEDVATLAKEYVEKLNFISTTSRVPPEGATPEEWDAFYQKQGAPSSFEGYSPVETDHEALAKTAADLRDVSKQHGLSDKQYTALMQAMVSQASSELDTSRDQIKSERSKWETEAKEKYGDKYEEKMAGAERFRDKLVNGNELVKRLLGTTGLSDHPAFTELFLQVADVAGMEGTPMSIDGDGGSFGESDAVKIAAEGRAIPGKVKDLERNDPEKKAAMARYYDIQKLLAKEGYKGVLDPKLMPASTDFTVDQVFIER